MNVEQFRDYCLSKKGVEESFPFSESTLVFKVMGRMFALTNLDRDEFKVNLKCDPERAILLREEFDEVQAGYHMNKKHWNTVSFEGLLDEKMLLELIDHSYDLVVKTLTRKNRELLAEL